ncbi:hypothetical protein [Anaerobaca lacustris]|uniref:HNH endonuclease n=1 Tax=Anaerobaca lacustris TaxID=3044600 RepID=A0AAW6U3W7_9BACT|nr:hypothetical protein [Sedimentisphaerales bacterium M17dextr]
MIEITTHQKAQDVARLGFCYVCGQDFSDDRKRTSDHVPPKSIFRSEDRDWPLILPAHEKCNSDYSKVDEQAMGLIGLLHPERPRQVPARTTIVGIAERDGRPAAVLLAGLKLRPMITKIFRACHTALYRVFMPLKTKNLILTPLLELDPKTRQPIPHTLLPQHQMACKILKDNRRIGNVDRVHANNRRFRFEVVWGTCDDGWRHFAAFAIDIYNWHLLGNRAIGHPQGCIGMHFSNDPIPPNASVVPTIELPFTWSEPLNPFEE